MKKIEKRKAGSKNQVTISEADNTSEEQDIDSFLKKKRIQNMVLRRIIDQIKEEEGGDDTPFETHKQ